MISTERNEICLPTIKGRVKAALQAMASFYQNGEPEPEHPLTSLHVSNNATNPDKNSSDYVVTPLPRDHEVPATILPKIKRS